MTRTRLMACLFLASPTLLLVEPAAHAQHGIILSGGGPITRSMGGTGTANPLDSLGCFFWNPAGLPPCRTTR